MNTHDPLITITTSRDLNGNDVPIHQVRCACRWSLNYAPHTRAEADEAHTQHVHDIATITVPVLTPGDRVCFDGKNVTWTVRATACAGRYALATYRTRPSKQNDAGNVYYTIIDRLWQVRGPLNVIGNGMGIDTTAGFDQGIEDTIASLEGRPNAFELAYYNHPADAWVHQGEISHRNRVQLSLTGHIPTAAPADRA